jgi:hypothetical protein
MGRLAAAASLGVAALTLAACGSAAVVQATSTSTSVLPTTSTPARVATFCTTAQLAVTSSGNSGMGHIGVVLIFTNISATPCVEVGYPGVAALTAEGIQAVQALRTPGGYLQGGTSRKEVTLASGQSASAIVEGTDVPTGTATSCPSYPKLLVTPPNATEQVVISAVMPGCSPIEVHPVVSGATGMVG